MSLIVNDTEVESVTFNGVELDKIIYDGVVVFEKIKESYLIHFTVDSSATSFEIRREW